MAVETLEDYLAVLDLLCKEAKERGAVCLTDDDTAYDRTLQFDNVPEARASRAFGRKRSELAPQEIKDFQDFIMWKLVAFAARHDLSYQIHTGMGRVQGFEPHAAGRPDRGKPSNSLRDHARRVSLDRRNRRHRFH